MKSFDVSEYHEILLLLVHCIGFHFHNEIWQISHEIHMKSVKTTDMESDGFHIKSIKSTLKSIMKSTLKSAL